MSPDRTPLNVLSIALLFAAWIVMLALLVRYLTPGDDGDGPGDADFPTDPLPDPPGPAVPVLEPEVLASMRAREMAP